MISGNTKTHFVLLNENPWSIIAANVAELGVLDVKPDFSKTTD